MSIIIDWFWMSLFVSCAIGGAILIANWHTWGGDE